MKYRALLVTGEILRFEADDFEGENDELRFIDETGAVVLLIPPRQAIYIAADSVTTEPKK